MRLVGAVDVDPAKVGWALTRLVGPAAPVSGRQRGAPSVAVSAKVAPILKDALGRRKADVVLHTTQSSFTEVFPQIAECVEAGLPVISSTEELAFPRAANPRLASRLDTLAKRRGVVVLGTGVNPGFVMDVLPVVASGASCNVRQIHVERILDAGRRRESFQEKVCVGRSPAETRRLLRTGKAGHVGLEHSLFLLAEGCGLSFDTVRKSSSPVIATRTLSSAFGRIQPGQVAGLRQSVRAVRRGRTVISLEMEMALGVANPHDAAQIHGDPPVHLKIEGGLFGDTATVATLLNAVPRVLGAAPGLRTVLDLPAPRTWSQPPAS
jgi:4-hydroxy-tetrahydrodipicolinate reductase